MDTLLNRKILVAGAAGGVGEGIVRALLERGAMVIDLSRSSERLDQVRTYLSDVASGGLVPLVGNLDQDEEGSAQLQQQLRHRFGMLDGAVIAIGAWGEASRPLLKVTDRIWAHSIADNLTSHFRAIRMLAPLIRPTTGALVHLTGLSADRPFPGAGLIGLTNAAQKSLVMTLAEEVGPAGPRIHEVMLGVIRTRSRERQGVNNPALYTPREVGHAVAALIAGESPVADETLHYLVERSKRSASMHGRG